MHKTLILVAALLGLAFSPARADISTNLPGQTAPKATAPAATPAAPAKAPAAPDPKQELKQLAKSLKAAIQAKVAELAETSGPMKNITVRISPSNGAALVSMDNDKNGPVTFLFLPQGGEYLVLMYFVPFDVEKYAK